MTAHPLTAHPPVPPAGRSTKGPGDATPTKSDMHKGTESDPPNTEKQGQQGNIKQNTTNQGYQQDR
jgi:hypothetical protein